MFKIFFLTIPSNFNPSVLQVTASLRNENHLFKILIAHSSVSQSPIKTFLSSPLWKLLMSRSQASNFVRRLFCKISDSRRAESETDNGPCPTKASLLMEFRDCVYGRGQLCHSYRLLRGGAGPAIIVITLSTFLWVVGAQGS
ncbi:hypothetical protein BaRGS_00010111 [Batillaria attramentaria]|uniref:Uncharacterized protein n=1 Tax=Batillaria attramentaria TaxID=370345 RepID=A0ABD0LGL9_9CAEN